MGGIWVGHVYTSPRSAVLREYHRGAKDRGFVWNLSGEQFDKLTSSNCHYCGIPPYTVKKNRHRNGQFVYNGIDRVDNSQGYEIENCVSCCKVCNRAKDIMGLEEFLSWVRRIARRHHPKFMVAAV